MVLNVGQTITAKIDMVPILVKGNTYAIYNLDSTWKTFSFLGTNLKMVVLGQDRLATYFELPAPVSLEPAAQCTCGAVHVQGKHSSWCDIEMVKI